MVGARSAAPVTPKRADERHINCYLHASKGRESMRDDLEPAPVGQWQPEVRAGLQPRLGAAPEEHERRDIFFLTHLFASAQAVKHVLKGESRALEHRHS